MEDRAAPRLGHDARAPLEPSTNLHTPTILDFRPPDGARAADRSLVAGYELLEEIGQGGMGIVYRARQVRLDRIVAIKMIRAAHARRDDLIRFRGEALAVAQLQHPNIVQVFEVGEHRGDPYLVLEYCAGGSLEQRLHGQPLPPVQAAELVETLARAVQVAHQAGIIHRDLKPANVLLAHTAAFAPEEDPPGRSCAGSAHTIALTALTPKITDFGLAKKLDEIGQTRTGAIMGTPAYMAPEQAAGEAVGPAADIYALGAILYECLTGKPPFQADGVLQTLEQVRQGEPVPPRQLGAGVPRDLEIIALKCLHKQPARRYASAAALADDLGRWRRGEPIQARPARLVERAVHWARRRPTAATLLLAVALLVAAVPLHIIRLHAREAATRAAMEQIHEDNRRTRLRARCERYLAEGRVVLLRPGLAAAQEARTLFATVEDEIAPADVQADDDLWRLHGLARRLRLAAEEQVRQRVDAELARSRAHCFLDLRDEAFFLLHRDLVTGVDRHGARLACVVARKALVACPELSSLPEGERAIVALARQEVQFLLAEATARSGAWAEAVRLLDRLTDTGQPMKSVHRRRALYLERLGRQMEAAKERCRADAVPARGALDWFLSALDRWRGGDLDGALADLDRALEEQPGLFWAQLLRGIGHMKRKEPAEARAALAACVRSRPGFAWTYLLRAVLHTQAGRYREAADDLDRVERLAADEAAHYALHLNRGVLALAEGHPRAAAAHFQRAVFLWPDRYHAHANLAQAYAADGQLDRAVALLDHAVHLAPGRADLYRSRAGLYLRRGQAARALRDLDAAIARTPPRRPAAEQAVDRRERARILYALARYPEALAASEEALRWQPDEPAALRVRAETLLELGRHRDALAAFDRYAARGRVDVELYRRRARARAGAGDLPGVIDDLGRALALRREPDLLTARGWAYLLGGAARLAKADFEEALTREPACSEARAGRGACRLELGELSAGAADIEAAVKPPDTPHLLLYRCARALAQAATHPGRQAATFRERSVDLLARAVAALPPARRADFWQGQVRHDSAFVPLARQPGFVRLDQQFARRP